MSEELAYALITPYSLYKSRTGGIIGRLLANASWSSSPSRMFVFSDEFLDAYKKVVCAPGHGPGDRRGVAGRTSTTNLRQRTRGAILPRCMLLLFRGPNAVRHLKEDVIGSFTEQPVGDTIRGTFGDFLRDADGAVHYFEPAVITCPDPELNRAHLELFAEYAGRDGGVLDRADPVRRPATSRPRWSCSSPTTSSAAAAGRATSSTPSA